MRRDEKKMVLRVVPGIGRNYGKVVYVKYCASGLLLMCLKGLEGYLFNTWHFKNITGSKVH